MSSPCNKDIELLHRYNLIIRETQEFFLFRLHNHENTSHMCEFKLTLGEAGKGK